MALSADEKLELTPEQAKQFKALCAAFKRCEKAGIRFEMSGETLIPMNGRYVVSVDEGDPQGDNEVELQDVPMPHLDGMPSPWVDVEVSVKVK